MIYGITFWNITESEQIWRERKHWIYVLGITYIRVWFWVSSIGTWWVWRLWWVLDWVFPPGYLRFGTFLFTCRKFCIRLIHVRGTPAQHVQIGVGGLLSALSENMWWRCFLFWNLFLYIKYLVTIQYVIHLR